MREEIRKAVNESKEKLKDKYNLPDLDADFEIEIPKNDKFGDFSTNIALILSGKVGKNPREIASDLVDLLKDSGNPIFGNIDVAGPGFINFYVKNQAVTSRLKDILVDPEAWGSSDVGKGHKVLVEFVSANPTGFLHFGHARNAVVGDTICRILEYSGYDVTREFYVNDAGRQMQLLGESVYTRYSNIFGKGVIFPEDGYKGEYVFDLAEELKTEYGDSLIYKEYSESTEFCREYAYRKLLEQFKTDLGDIGIKFDNWYSEREQIHHKNELDNIIELLGEKNALVSKDGAIWFAATDFGDNQDWVLIKQDGTPTYFLADIAYHYDKFKRNYDKIINIWGADHHSHFNRLRSSVKALGYDESLLEVVLIQFVRLVKEGVEVSMSKREGSFITLREVMEEVGKDVTRFFLLMRSSDSHMDFDLDLAKSQSSENPVFYIQYAHARIMSVFRKAGAEDITLSEKHLHMLDLKEEIEISKKLLQFTEVVQSSAHTLSPHKITYYLQDLASGFHIYYNKNKIVGDDRELSSARLYLAECIRHVLRNGLNLLGVNAPSRM